MIHRHIVQFISAVLMLSLIPLSASAHPQQKGQGADPGNTSYGAPRQGAEQRFAAMDTSGDGLISPAEFEAADHPHFARLDTNDDGVLTLDEMKQTVDRKVGKRGMRHFEAMDDDNDGSITREEMLHNAFARMDRDQDGSLTAEELDARRSFNRQRSDGPPRAMAAQLKDMDTDGDGKVSVAEFNNYDHPHFSSLDSDGDGVVNAEELRESAGARMNQRLETHFAEMDQNGDGMVTLIEMQTQAFARMDTNGDGMLSPAELGQHRGPGGKRGD